MEEEYMKSPPDVISQQQRSNVDKGYSESKRTDSGPNGCMRCCMSTKNCLMSPECGRALSIASVVSMCGMCIRMWTCKFKPSELFLNNLHNQNVICYTKYYKWYKLTTSANYNVTQCTILLKKNMRYTFQNPLSTITLQKAITAQFIRMLAAN